MRPFFKHFGSKWSLSANLPPPRYSTIVEPFAGAAGYSVRYGEGRRVILYDTSPDVCAIWDYLLGASHADIMRLPVGFGRADIRELGLARPEMLLIQRWLTTQGNLTNWKVTPALDSDQARNQSISWGAPIRARIAKQLQGIRLWDIVEASYEASPDIEANWIVDPVYQKNIHANVAYKCKPLDYRALAQWCQSLRGDVAVHEQDGADWLPFKPFKAGVSTGRNTRANGAKRQNEVIWYGGSKKEAHLG